MLQYIGPQAIRMNKNLASLSVSQRVLSLGAAAVLNGAVLALLIMLRSQTPATAGKIDHGLISISIATAPQAQKQLPVIRHILPLRTEAADLPAEAAAAAPSPRGTSDDCPVVEDVAKGILADPAALDAIIHAPPDTRSIADAIVIWNLAWAPATAPATTDAQSPLGPVRTNVMATLVSLPQDCLSSIVSGPRLIAVPNGERTLILVFGSGDWSWKSLIEPDPAENDAQAPGYGVEITPTRNRIVDQLSMAKFSYRTVGVSQYL